MKIFVLNSAIVVCALSAPMASAQDSPAPASAGTDMSMHTQTEEPMSQMQDNMKAMQAQMDKIHGTTDAKERQKLMQEHMRAMQNNMKSMRGMGGSMMMGDKKGGMAESDMMNCGEMTGKRMDMMQMMMEQMMQRDQAMESMPDM